jgi:hypothetical protein
VEEGSRGASPPVGEAMVISQCGGLGLGLGSFSRCVYDGGGGITRYHPVLACVFKLVVGS